MPTAFEFETVFRAPSTTAVLDGYFDPEHLAAQDAAAELGDRTIVEQRDDGAVRECSWRVSALKPLPLFVRPFVSGGRLRYRESMRLRRSDGEIDLTIQPEVLGGRVHIDAVYRLTSAGDGQVRRRYSGTITVEIRLLSSRIERAILDTITGGMPLMTACTQTWLDTISQRSSAP
jgi:hypothetical protein